MSPISKMAAASLCASMIAAPFVGTRIIDMSRRSAESGLQAAGRWRRCASSISARPPQRPGPASGGHEPRIAQWNAAAPDDGGGQWRTIDRQGGIRSPRPTPSFESYHAGSTTNIAAQPAETNIASASDDYEIARVFRAGGSFADPDNAQRAREGVANSAVSRLRNSWARGPPLSRPHRPDGMRARRSWPCARRSISVIPIAALIMANAALWGSSLARWPRSMPMSFALMRRISTGGVCLASPHDHPSCACHCLRRPPFIGSRCAQTAPCRRRSKRRVPNAILIDARTGHVFYEKNADELIAGQHEQAYDGDPGVRCAEGRQAHHGSGIPDQRGCLAARRRAGRRLRPCMRARIRGSNSPISSRA